MKSTAATSPLPYVHTSELYVFFFLILSIYFVWIGVGHVFVSSRRRKGYYHACSYRKDAQMSEFAIISLYLYYKESLALSLSHFSVWTWRESGQCTDSLIPCAQEPGKVLPNCPSDTSLAACMKEKLEIKFTLCSQQELILIKCPGQTQ